MFNTSITFRSQLPSSLTRQWAAALHYPPCAQYQLSQSKEMGHGLLSVVMSHMIERMDCYLNNESGDLTVPRDRVALEALCSEDISPSPIDWCHWGFTGSDRPKPTLQRFGFDRPNPYIQIGKAPSVHEADGSNSSAYEGPSFVGCRARTSGASLYGPSDFQLPKSMDWTDNIYMNSLLEEEDLNNENPLESQNMLDPIHRSPSFEKNMLVDARSLMMDMARREASMSTCRLTSLTNDISDTWGNEEDCSPSFLMPEESKRSEGLDTDPDQTIFVPAEPKATNEGEAVFDVDEPKCLEETVLQDLDDIMIQLSGKTRICFRDALYRLAKISKQKCTISPNINANFIDRPLFAEVNGECPSMGGSGSAESETNVVDRTIANLMFNLPNYHPQDLPPTESLYKSYESLPSSGSYYYSEQQIPPHHYQGQITYGFS